MNDINKQKFLAELGKLLTFMYEEDRQTALAMYGKMFDDTDDEQGLIHFLGSPTRQAVVVARTYNARVRKLQVESQSRETEGAEPEAAPDFVLAIDKLYQQYIPEQSEGYQVMEDQFSLFEDAGQPVEDGMDETYPVLDVNGDGRFQSAQAPAAPAQAPAMSTAQAAEQAFEGVEAPAAADEVESFLSDFNIEDPELGDASEEAPAAPEEAAEEILPAEPQLVRKPKVFLLILFVLLAVPITLACVVLLLIPTLLFLALAAAAIAAGATLLVAAFGGFKILADFLLLFGAAIVLLALGLLFLWIFIWFIGSVIAGLITSVIELGRRWCYKEVAA